MSRLPDPFPQLPLAKGVVAQNYHANPFSVIDARVRPWQDRKRAWIDTFDLRAYQGRSAQAYHISKDATSTSTAQGVSGAADDDNKGVSVFDPVLAETLYQWYCPAGGRVLDPFGGDIGRGYTAARLGLHFTGLELRAEQVAANNAKAPTDTPGSALWIEGDAGATLERRRARGVEPGFDMLIACPPYGPLERYSDDPADLSTMGRRAFVIALRDILTAAVNELKNDSFVAFVVGDYRLPDGSVACMTADMVHCFEHAGLMLYNVGTYLTPLGSTPLRATPTFYRGKGKLARVAQSFVIGVKGDPTRAFDRVWGDFVPVSSVPGKAGAPAED